MLFLIRSWRKMAPIVVDNLRPPNSRPDVLVSPAAAGIVDPSSVFVGFNRAFGRERCLYALPLDPGPALLYPPTVVRDPTVAFIADTGGALIGVAPVWVSRMLAALPTEDTRGLG